MKLDSVKEILRWATELLKNSAIENPQLDAKVLLAYALDKDQVQLYTYPDYVLSEGEILHYKALIEKRQKRIPISYITGHKEFMSLDIKVNRNVLIPRPETEILVETVCKFRSNIIPYSFQKKIGVFDLGTGSGAIAISLAKYNPDWSILATDTSMASLLIARENAIHHEVIDRVSFVQTDLFDGISQNSKFDWVVSNPPYIPTGDLPSLPDEIRKYEPILALDGGIDGLDVIKRIIEKAFMFLKPFGHLAIEIGYGQSNNVQRIAEETGKYSNYMLVNDYSGIQRVFYCELK